jgi:hypothetical protein
MLRKRLFIGIAPASRHNLARQLAGLVGVWGKVFRFLP